MIDFALIKFSGCSNCYIQCNYLMILLRNCKLWTVLVTQFMYSLELLSFCSFSKLGYTNTYFTSVIEMFEL